MSSNYLNVIPDTLGQYRWRPTGFLQLFNQFRQTLQITRKSQLIVLKGRKGGEKESVDMGKTTFIV